MQKKTLEAEQRQPRDRLARESRPAHEAFLAYLQAGPGRSLRRTAKLLGKNVALLKRWSVRHGWAERVRALEAQQAPVEEETTRQARVKTFRRRTEHAAQVEQIAMAGLQTLLVRDPDTGKLRFDARLKPTDVAALIRAACQLLPTNEPEAQAESGEDQESELSRLSTGQLQSLLAMLPTTEGNREDEDDNHAE
jgi:hypothetical protein